MKRIIVHRSMVVLALAALALAAGTVWADSPHFVKGPTASVDTSTGELCVSFKEAGLGNTPITYELTASNATFTFQCFTKSNNQPQGAPNSVSFSNDSTFVTLNPRNGQITGSVCLEPKQDGADCQGKGLKLCLIAVEYDSATFRDTTTPLPSSGPLSLGTFGPMSLAKPDCTFK